jgi:hypothetical protein
MNDADFSALPLFAGARGMIPAGYHLRPEGRKCPRGHSGPYRDSRKDCAACRRLEAPSWRITRETGHAFASGRPIPLDCSFVIGASDETIRNHLLEGCRRERVAARDYGWVWGIFHVKPLRGFDLATTAGLREANQLANLRVERLHNARPRPVPSQADLPNLFA